jgi:hypothetical protein
LLPAIPPLLFFLGAGLHSIGTATASLVPAKVRFYSIVACIVCVYFVVFETVPYRKLWAGYRDVVQALKADTSNLITLISSDPQGEGMMIAETALAEDRRPNRYILRASKILSSSSWSGRDYKNYFNSANDIAEFLRQSCVDTIVFDTSINSADTPPHHQQLGQMLLEFTHDWALSGKYNIVRNGKLFPNAIHVYRYVGPKATRPPYIEIDMDFMLGRKIKSIIRPSMVEPNQAPP